MCVSTDGYRSELKVMSTTELFNAVVRLFQEYNIAQHMYYMSAYKDTYMRESQFAQFLGRCRLYQFLPVDQKKKLPQMLMTDTQIGLVAKAYYNDDNFSTLLDSREISMWNVYNLLTGANKVATLITSWTGHLMPLNWQKDLIRLYMVRMNIVGSLISVSYGQYNECSRGSIEL